MKASPKIAQPDITIGIPALLVDIEMALFAVLHIWAYPWKAYSVHNPQLANAESGAGYNLDKSEYKGGPLGLYAYMDAFNPWDIIKAVGRGFKWAVIGRKSREQDVSYQPGYQGNTQLQDSAVPKVKLGSYEPLDGEPDEDARFSSSYDPYRVQGQSQDQGQARPAGPPNELGAGRLGMGSTEAFAAAPLSRPGNAPLPVQGGGFADNADTGYHGGRTDAKMPDEGDFVHAR